MNRIIFRGHLDTFTGFGQQFCSLIQFCIRHGYEVSVVSLGTSELFTSTVPKEITERIVPESKEHPFVWEAMHLSGKQSPQANVIVSTVWESTRVFGAAVASLNQARCVVVPSDWCAEALARSGVTVPVRVVPHGLDKNVFGYRRQRPDDLCVFGTAGRMAHGRKRKGVETVMAAFRKAFPKEEDVRLRIKCFPDCDIESGPLDPRIERVTRFLDPAGVADWLGDLTCFVSAARAEGWGLWQHQALAVGRPVIAPFYGGLQMFLTERNCYPVNHGVETAGEFNAGHGSWCVPDEDSLVEQMRRVYGDRREAEVKGLAATVDTSDLTIERSCAEALGVMHEFQAFTVSVPKVLTFKHSGDFGDVIYALPTIKALGGGILYLTQSKWTRLPMTPERAHDLAGLLMLQPYIKEVRIGMPPTKVDWDLDEFRQEHWFKEQAPGRSIVESVAATVGLDSSIGNEPWLQVDYPTVIPGKPVVVNRTERYQNPSFQWGAAAKLYRNQAVFVGYDDEYHALQRVAAWPELERLHVASVLDLARAVAGCKLFVGNQSLAYALAEGMKKPAVLEVWKHRPDCLFRRENVWNSTSGKFTFPTLSNLTTP